MTSFKVTAPTAPSKYDWKIYYDWKFHSKSAKESFPDLYPMKVVEQFMVFNDLRWVDDLHNPVFGPWKSKLPSSLYYFRGSNLPTHCPTLKDWQLWWKYVQKLRIDPRYNLLCGSYKLVEEFMLCNGIYHSDGYQLDSVTRKRFKNQESSMQMLEMLDKNWTFLHDIDIEGVENLINTVHDEEPTAKKLKDIPNLTPDEWNTYIEDLFKDQ